MDLSYKGTEIESTEYFSNSQNLQLLSNKWSLSKLDDPVDKDEYVFLITNFLNNKEY